MTPERRSQIEELYRAACNRGRKALAGADPELRAEVEKLLAEDSGDKLPYALATEMLPRQCRFSGASTHYARNATGLGHTARFFNSLAFASQLAPKRANSSREPGKHRWAHNAPSAGN